MMIVFLVGQVFSKDHSIMQLKGRWTGLMTSNDKSSLGGGHPTLGESGSLIQLTLMEKEFRLEGDLQIGKEREHWEFSKDLYTWKNEKITFITKRKPISSLDKDIKNRLNLKNEQNVWIYTFEDCFINGDPKVKCESPKDIPLGSQETGVWVFKLEGNRLLSNVYYTYPDTGKKRILEQILNRN